MMEIKRIQKVNLSDQVYKQILEMILAGKWRPNDRFPSEAELSGAFGVSRVTVRHALQRLSALGLLETRVGEGTFVRELSFGVNMNQVIPAIYLAEDSILETMEFRVITEVETAALAARRADRSDIQRLWKSYDGMLSSGTDLQQYVALDFHFHRLLATITGNSIMIKMHYIMRDALQQSITRLTSVVGTENGIRFHKQIIEAIEKHDEDAARNHMRNHLTNTLELFHNTSTTSHNDQ